MGALPMRSLSKTMKRDVHLFHAVVSRETALVSARFTFRFTPSPHVREQIADTVCPDPARPATPPRQMSGRTAIRRWVGRAALLVVENSSRCGFAQFKLVTHFLEALRESVNLLLQLRDGRFLLLVPVMFFEELI